MRNYRSIWRKYFGEIPKDKHGRSYEIHHIDGNHSNNSIDNLKLVSIEEHYDIHEKQGDWVACALISKRMDLPANHMSELQKGKKRPGVGGAKPGRIPWNKGIINCFSQATIDKMKSTRSGRVFYSKLTKEDVSKIRDRFIKHKQIHGVGLKQKNGRVLTQERAFSNLYHKDYGISAVGLFNIVKGLCWAQ